jgi:hypothetical protein
MRKIYTYVTGLARFKCFQRDLSVNFGKIGNMPHPGDVEIFMSHLESLRFISRPECRTCPNITPDLTKSD